MDAVSHLALKLFARNEQMVRVRYAMQGSFVQVSIGNALQG